MKITIEMDIKCCAECYYFDNKHFTLLCDHPDAPEEIKGYKGWILKYPDCNNGFPELCPFLNPKQ